MARSLLKFTCLNLTTQSSSSSRIILFPRRSFSGLPISNADLDDQSSNDPLVRILEDAIHKIIVRRSTPDWLPFLPGSSYWVPPTPSSSSSSFRGSLPIPHLVEKLAHPFPSAAQVSLSSSSRGWPSHDYFIQGALIQQMELNVPSEDVEVEAPSSNASNSEEGKG